MLMRKTPQQGAIWHSSEPLGIRGPSRQSKKAQFLVSDRDSDKHFFSNPTPFQSPVTWVVEHDAQG